MVYHYTLTLTGSVQQLSTVLTPSVVNPSAKFLSLQAGGGNSGVVYYGGFPQLLSSTDYGGRIEIPVSTVPAAPTIFELVTNCMVLSEFQVLGTQNDVLHLLVKE